MKGVPFHMNNERPEMSWAAGFSLPISREPRMTDVINQDGDARELVWN